MTAPTLQVERQNGRGRQPAAVEALADARDEQHAHDSEDEAFAVRVVEDVARIRCALTADLPLIAEQLASRLLVIAERRVRQLGREPIDVRKFGAR